MSEDKQAGLFTLTQPAILAFPDALFVQKAYKGKGGKELGEPKYSANFVISPDSSDLVAMKAVAAKVARAKWPERDFKTLAWPFTSGDKLADAAKAKGKNGEYQRGKVVITARSTYRPGLSIAQNGKVVDLLDESQIRQFKGQFYFGALVYAQFNFVAYEVGSNTPGVTAYLNSVFSTGKGDRIAGPRPGSEVFKGYVGNVTMEDPTAGQSVADEIPF